MPTTPARRSLNDIPVCKMILDGDCDEELRNVEAAVAHRRKMLDRATGAMVGSRFRVTQQGDRFGAEGTILKVNPKKYVIHFDGEDIHCEYTCPKSMVEITEARPARNLHAEAVAAEEAEWQAKMDALPSYRDLATGAEVTEMPIDMRLPR